jgi:DNA-binding transcriptional regulator YhcF (GntR family)
MQADGQPFTSFNGSPMVPEAVREFQAKSFTVKVDRPIHIGDIYRNVAAREHAQPPHGDSETAIASHTRAIMQRAVFDVNGAILKRPIQCQLPPLKLVRHAPQTLAVQVSEALRIAILNQTVPPGSFLPSTRRLALALGISRNTVLQAYELLWLDGLVTARSGSGTRANANFGPKDRNRAPKLPGVAEILKASMYPLRVQEFLDQDGNVLSLRY